MRILKKSPSFLNLFWRLPATHWILAAEVVWVVSDWWIVLLDGVYMVASA